MYLIDTNVISELRKGGKANPGVRKFFDLAVRRESRLFLSVITLGELRRGVELIRHRGDLSQAALLEKWLDKLSVDFSDSILEIDADVAQVWGKLRVPNHENAIDKQIAATALVHALTLVTRNQNDFSNMGVPVQNPFQ